MISWNPIRTRRSGPSKERFYSRDSAGHELGISSGEFLLNHTRYKKSSQDIQRSGMNPDNKMIFWGDCGKKGFLVWAHIILSPGNGDL